jgi:hypothetical protein
LAPERDGDKARSFQRRPDSRSVVGVGSLSKDMIGQISRTEGTGRRQEETKPWAGKKSRKKLSTNRLSQGLTEEDAGMYRKHDETVLRLKREIRLVRSGKKRKTRT